MDGPRHAEPGIDTPHAIERFSAQWLSHIEDINEGCLDLLLAAARLDKSTTPTLVSQLRPFLSHIHPARRSLFTQQVLPLVDVHFRTDAWWRAVTTNPSGAWTHHVWAHRVPRYPAVRLTRTTLIVCWKNLHEDMELTRTLFGMSRAVAELIAELRLATIERIAEHQFRHVRPRWDERAWLWLKLAKAAAANDPHTLRDFHIHALQLLAGESVPRSQSV